VTQQELAEEIGVTRQTLNGWEKGIVEPRGENHARYLDVLDRMQQRIDQRVEQGDNT
jgi:DNA-binding XRE family transcriptional regulator